MPLEVNPDNVPEELKSVDRWIVWKVVREKNPKTGQIEDKKVAVDERGLACNWKKKKAWRTFDEAVVEYRKKKLAGVGIVLTGEDGLFGMDLDDAYSSDLLKDSTYSELSPSGKGVHSLGFVESLDVSRHPKGVGFFTHNRWLAVTGHRVSKIGYLADCTRTVQNFLENLADRGSGPGGTLSKERLTELLRENWRFAKIWKFEAIKDYDTLSEMDGAIAWHAVKSGWTDAETVALVTEFRHRLHAEGYETKGKEDRLDYASKTVERVRQQIGVEVDEIPYLTLQQALEVPPTKWLVDGVIPDGGFGMVWGPWGTCKTFMMLDLSMRLICNMQWFGERKIKHGDVLYILSEGVWTIGDRLRAWFNHHEDEKAVHKFAVWESAPQIVNSSDVNDISQFIERRLPKCKLVVFDTLSRSLVGQNENDSMFMTKMVDQMTRLGRKTGVTVMLVHHATKGGIEGPPTARGSSAIAGAVDFSIEVGRVFAAGKLRGQRAPMTGIFDVSCDKARGGPPFDSFPVYFKTSGPGVVLETSKILTDWLAHMKHRGSNFTADQFVAILEYKKKGLATATMEGLLRANGIGMSRARIESVIDELFPVSSNSSH